MLYVMQYLYFKWQSWVPVMDEPPSRLDNLDHRR